MEARFLFLSWRKPSFSMCMVQCKLSQISTKLTIFRPLKRPSYVSKRLFDIIMGIGRFFKGLSLQRRYHQTRWKYWSLASMWNISLKIGHSLVSLLLETSKLIIRRVTTRYLWSDNGLRLLRFWGQSRRRSWLPVRNRETMTRRHFFQLKRLTWPYSWTGPHRSPASSGLKSTTVANLRSAK